MFVFWCSFTNSVTSPSTSNICMIFCVDESVQMNIYFSYIIFSKKLVSIDFTLIECFHTSFHNTFSLRDNPLHKSSMCLIQWNYRPLHSCDKKIMVMFDIPCINENDVPFLQKHLFLINHVFPATGVVIRSLYSVNPVFHMVYGHNHVLDMFQVLTDTGFHGALGNKAHPFLTHMPWMSGNYWSPNVTQFHNVGDQLLPYSDGLGCQRAMTKVTALSGVQS